MIKAVIFDLDGVLVSTDMMHFMAWKKIAEEININNFTEEDNLRQRGVSRMASLDILLEKADRAYSEQEKEELARRKNEYYISLIKDLTPGDVLPGVLTVIHTLKQNGIAIGIGSASKNTPEILCRTGLDAYIDQVSCGLDITKSKPDPQVFLIAAQKLKMNPSDCLVVEDSDSGIQAAKAGGMCALAVGSAYNNQQAEFHAKSLDGFDIQAVIKQAH